MKLFRSRKKSVITENMKIPVHIAIIMDGNGRWAKIRGLPRSAGHRAGAMTLRRIIEYCHDVGIRHLTVYAFSTENWQRPPEEVEALMKLFLENLRDSENQLKGNDVRIRIIGDRTSFSQEIQAEMLRTEEYSKNNSRLTLHLAVNYGSRAEIKRAVQSLAQDVKAGKIKPEDIDEGMINSRLYTGDIPDPDVIVRPSGELRLSNFLLWQAAYSEFWFSDILWPDFKNSDIDQIILDYNKRDRRYGKI